MSPATLAPRRGAFCLGARTRASYLLRTQFQAAGCGDSGVAETSACPSPFTPAGGPLLLEVGKRGGTGEGRWRAANLHDSRPGEGAGRRVGAPPGCVSSDYEVPTPLPGERKRDAQTPPLHN